MEELERFILRLLFRKHKGVVIYKKVPKEGDTITIGNMTAVFKQNK